MSGALLAHLVPATVAAVEAFGETDGARPLPEEEPLIARAVERRRREFITAGACARTGPVRDEQIRVSAVLPSIIDTPATRAAQPNADSSRWVSPEQIADVIASDCSDASEATSGAHIPVYGRA